jgi:hypothetical protein
MPLRVVLLGLALGTITLFIIVFWIDRGLKKHH